MTVSNHERPAHARASGVTFRAATRAERGAVLRVLGAERDDAWTAQRAGLWDRASPGPSAVGSR